MGDGAFIKEWFPAGKIARVLLVNPPDCDAAEFDYNLGRRHRYPNHPAYGLAVLASHLTEVEVAPRILNLNQHVLQQCDSSVDEASFDYDAVWQSALQQEIDDFKPDLVCVTCMFTLTHQSFLNVCREVIARNLPLAVGGVHVTSDFERILDALGTRCVVFLGESDTSVKQFVRAVRGEVGLGDIGRIVLNDPDTGREVLQKDANLGTSNFDVLPRFDLLDVTAASRYGTIGNFWFLKEPNTPMATVLTNRGCRAHCTFCSVRSFNGRGVRQRSVDSVVEELRILSSEFGVKHVMWLDDDLLKDHARAIHLFNEMVRQNLPMTWDASNGVIAASCTPEVIDAASASGCIALNIGMESGNRQILRQIAKPATVECLLRAAETLRKYEQIYSNVFLMYGFPGETFSMLKDTVEVAEQMGLDWYRIGYLQPLPNTPIYHQMLSQGFVSPLGDRSIRYSCGSTGKHVNSHVVSQGGPRDFAELLDSSTEVRSLDDEEVAELWFFLNSRLNFFRAPETRRPKLEQRAKQLRVIVDVIAQDHGFALQELCTIQKQLGVSFTQDAEGRLEKCKQTSEYWRQRFDQFPALGLRA